MGQVSLHGKHLLGLQHATPEEIKLILDVAKKMKKVVLSDDKKIPYLKGKAIINLFMEPSTRTRSSFELAGKYLGADVINITPSGSSMGHDVREAVKDADVVNVLRIQLERIHSALYPTNREYARIFGINKDVLSLAKDDVMVMHPGPMNRGLEISPDVAYWDQSVIQEQVRNGVSVRMAVLYLTIHGGDGSELAY